jgi:hypothetical protein
MAADGARAENADSHGVDVLSGVVRSPSVSDRVASGATNCAMHENRDGNA